MTQIQKLKEYMIWLLPICLALAYIWPYPFPNTLVSQTASIAGLNCAQKSNIRLVVSVLDGCIIAPGQTFSFNKIVGLRTIDQGYAKSPSYLDSGTPMTYGGGICLLSSLLYRNAIELGLIINERTAHTRITQCVPAGYDATVWYGQNDLKFTNNQKTPIKIVAAVNSEQLKVDIMGEGRAQITKAGTNLRRIIRHAGPNAIEVTVLRASGDQLALISRDSYALSRNQIENQIEQ